MSDLDDAPHALDPATLDGVTEAVAVVAPGLALRLANARFRDLPLTDADGRLAGDVGRAVSRLLAKGGGRERIRIVAEAGADAGAESDERVLDLVAVPLARGEALLTVLDQTMETGLRNALTESRARFKELVEISSDHAWEVGADGTFTFVAPEGFLGFGPKELIGTPPEKLIDADRFEGPVLPFTTPAALDPTDLWLTDSMGRLVCLEIAALPLLDRDGTWQGARGVCRDVTEDRRRQTEISEARVRDRTLARIIRLFRREAEPEAMIQAASTAITHGLSGTGCAIMGITTPLAKVVTRPVFQVESSFGRLGPTSATDRLLEAVAAEPDGVVVETAQTPEGEMKVMAAATAHGDRINGAVIIWRNPERPDFQEADRRLLSSVAGHMGVALAQLFNHRVLVDVSRTDPLTGLFNRRAFYEDINRRVRRMERSGKKAALVYVDLDNFKAVNDLRGHDAGDEALLRVSEVLHGNTRATDVVARLGGDEFAVWLDDADEEVGINRARVFLAASVALKKYSGAPDKPLTLSIGIAVYDPAWKEDLNGFISRADAAMYAIKRQGKGTFGVAPPPGRQGEPS